ncbi:MAG TPA: SDR family oxidoreductase [Opitutaceae bacterium]|jgi:NAD(P)-dependent dehydrogenase (short-subunit alcohol dehydrogenase family)
MELKGKVAVITGGGTGIGRATATLFAREGAAVLLAGRRRQPLEQTAAEIAREGGRAECMTADVTDARQVDLLVDEALRAFGKIDILFNNAGVFVSGREAQDFAEAEWDSVFRTNFLGTLHGCRAAVPHMKRNGGGVILNCSSVSGRIAQRLQAPYNVSKAAVEMLSKCMALELGPYNIRVNTICPNVTETDMTAASIAARGRANIEASYPLRRLGHPLDSAYAALYLASPRASWVSGNSLFVDGGSTCR